MREQGKSEESSFVSAREEAVLDSESTLRESWRLCSAQLSEQPEKYQKYCFVVRGQYLLVRSRDGPS